MGIVLTADGVAEASCRWRWRRCATARGSYASGFVLLVGLAVLGAVAVSFLPRPEPAAA